MVPQVINLVVSGAESLPPGSPVAHAVATSVLNELVILTFGAVDPLKLPPTEAGQAVMVEARAFQRVAIPRSAFASWIEQTVALIKQFEDRESFGWNKLQALVADGGKP